MQSTFTMIPLTRQLWS